MPTTDQHDIEFGPFGLNRRDRRLTRRGVPVSIGGRAFDILVALATMAGETVSKDALLDQVWPGLTVEENNLQVHISALRKALGEEWIITVPGRGYRLVVPLADVGLPSIDSPVDKPSIAVLPFDNFSGDREQEYFSDGIADEIITALSRNRSLFVIAGNSSFTYKGRAVNIKQVAQELGVRYVVEGSVRMISNRARIASRLIDASTGSHIWADRFEGTLEDIFALQDRVTECIIGAIEPNLQRAEIVRADAKPTESLNAYDLYLRATARYQKGTRDGNVEAEEILRRAIRIDTNYVLAKALLASVYFSRNAAGLGTAADVERGISLAREIAVSSTNDAEALRTAGHVLSHLAGDYDQARTLLDRAMLINPNSAKVLNSAGWVSLHRFDPEPAIGLFQRAMWISPLDPAMPFMSWGLGSAHIMTGRNVEGLAILRRAVQEKPDLTPVYRMLILALVRLGRIDEAQATARRILEIDPRYTLSSLQLPYSNQAFNNEFVTALRLAGLPE